MAAPNLPVGVLRNNTDGVSGDLRNIDFLTTEEVAQLWTTYNSKQALLANDVGRRLANFFWRLWSSDRLRSRLAGSQVARLFEGISQGNIIRTTPKSSPRHSRIIPASQSSIEEVAGTVEEVRKLSRDAAETGRDKTPIAASRTRDFAYPEQTENADECRPRPILKKPGSETSGSGKTARIQPPAFKTRESDPAHDEPMSPEEVKELTRQLSSESSTSGEDDTINDSRKLSVTAKTVEIPVRNATLAQTPTPHRMARSSSGQGSSRTSRKKPNFVVGASKRRPVLSRRQPSQNPPLGSLSKASGLRSSRTFDDIPSIAEVESTDMRRTRSGPGESAGGYRLTISRSASPISQSPLQRVSKDHRAFENDVPSATVHDRAISSIAPANEFVPLEREFSSVDMRRSSSSASYMSGAVTPKSSLANSSPSNVQASGQISLDQASTSISTTPRKAMAMIGRAGSFLTGRGRVRPAFEIGTPEAKSPSSSRRPSLEVQSPLSPITGLFSSSTSGSGTAIAPSRSQSQLSDLLDQARRQEAERDRRRALEEERSRKKL